MLNLLHDYLKQTIKSMRAVLVIKTFNIHRKSTVYIQPTTLCFTPHSKLIIQHIHYEDLSIKLRKQFD